MKNSIIISIIIPIYNVENYITQCLESVFSQDIPIENYEVICVDDFSPDNSKKIVKEFQKKYSNLFLIEHKSNKKLGFARNSGRSIAKGKYIWNVDSDDYLKKNVLNELLKTCEQNNLDVLIFNFDHLIFFPEKVNQKFPFICSPVLNGINFLKNYCIGNFSEISPIWSQIYRRNFLEENNIFSPPINMGEDVPFTFKTLLLARRIKSITNSCYVYRINKNSLGSTIEIKADYLKVYEKCFVCTRYLFDILKLIPKEEKEIRKSFLAVCKYIVSLYPNYLFNMDLVELKNFQKICRKNLINDFKILKLFGKKRLLMHITTVLFPIFKIYK
jgi:glycosyltransferase involved in cell wall biosynthesis